MALRKIRLGELISVVDERNTYGFNEFYGININKEFMPTAANTEGLDASKYKVVRKERFVFSGMQTGRDQCIRISMYQKDNPIIVSPAYTTFEISRKDLIIPTYFFMFFKSSEKDRLGAFYSDGSIRTNLDWERFCDIEIELPDLPTQEKFVKVYLSMLENQKSYERGLDDLKLVCDAYIEDLRKQHTSMSIIDFIEERTEMNKKGEVTFMKGVGLKGFIEPNQERSEDSLKKCNIFYKGDFVYAPSSFKNGVISYNDAYEIAICTEEYIVFKIKDLNVLDPYYLLMWLKREQLGRFIDFSSCDSVRNRFYFKDLVIVEIPVPPIEIQKKISQFYQTYLTRKQINEQLKEQIKNICPILIKGSIEEAKEA